ncbi:MAG: 3-phosphoshikimate 1-carboxyvinyltransferase [Flavobacteriales bacterium]
MTDIFPSLLEGEIAAPGSKSIAQRMIACALMASGESIIEAFPDSDDCRYALLAAQSLGAIITERDGTIRIKGGYPNSFHSGIRNPKSSIHCGESGLASRLFLPIAALYHEPIRIEGSGSLSSRPFEEFVPTLQQLGARCELHEGCLPAVVQGPLQKRESQVDGSRSSQFVSGLLIALAKLPGDASLRVTDLTSKPYVDLTIETLQRFGVELHHENYETFHIGFSAMKPVRAVVPGDWSAAAALLVAGAVSANESLTVTNIEATSKQADVRILDALRLAGVKLDVQDRHVRVFASEIQAFEFDANQCPDIIPPLVALAAFANGVSVIHGANRLVYKESHRAKVLQTEFAKCGVRIVLREDEMKIYPAPIRSTVIHAHGDHRIAMAGAILGLGGNRIRIQGASCVAKSYPRFFEDLIGAGARVTSSK